MGCGCSSYWFLQGHPSGIRKLLCCLLCLMEELSSPPSITSPLPAPSDQLPRPHFLTPAPHHTTDCSFFSKSSTFYITAMYKNTSRISLTVICREKSKPLNSASVVFATLSGSRSPSSRSNPTCQRTQTSGSSQDTCCLSPSRVFLTASSIPKPCCPGMLLQRQVLPRRLQWFPSAGSRP